MADSSGSSLSKVMADLYMQERSILHILKKTKHLRSLRKWLKKVIKKIPPSLASRLPQFDGEFEYKLMVVNLIIADLKFLVRTENNKGTEHMKEFWTEFWESSDDDDDEQEEFESANEDFPREEEQNNEEDQPTNLELIHSLLKKLVDAVTELKGSELEEGELEEILRDLKHLPELVDVVDNIPDEDIVLGVGEATIHEREPVVVTGNDVRNKEIVWPPMVIVMNTRRGKDDNGNWLGMGNVEAVKYFALSNAVGSKPAYGPQGHLGMNILIFEASAAGFMEAELLSKRFEDAGTGREDWHQNDCVQLYHGKRKLYGYMAKKSDVEIFNQYLTGESKLQVEMRSYQEMIVNPMKQLYMDFDIVDWYMDFINRVAKRQAYIEKYKKTLPQDVQEVLKRFSKKDRQSRDIVWPPVVIILNTGLDKYDNGKRLGMGDADVLEYCESFEVVRLHHSYGPKGHRGMSALIFESSMLGFTQATRLCKTLEDSIKDQDGCSCSKHRVLFLPNGKRNLYGHMAEESDMEIFNEHAQGESRLEFEMRSYQEMVVNPMKQMCQDYNMLTQYMSKVAKDHEHLFTFRFCQVSSEINLCPDSPEPISGSKLRPSPYKHKVESTSSSEHPWGSSCSSLFESTGSPEPISGSKLRPCPYKHKVESTSSSEHPWGSNCSSLFESTGSPEHLFESTGSPEHLFGSTSSPEHLFESTGSPEHLSESKLRGSPEINLYPGSPEQDKDEIRSYLALSKHQEEFFKNLQQEMQEWMEDSSSAEDYQKWFWP